MLVNSPSHLALFLLCNFVSKDIIVSSTINNSCKGQREVLEGLQRSNLKNYEKHLMPETTLTVKLTAQVLKIEEVSDMEKTFAVQMIMEETWTDHRLDYSKQNACAGNISVPRDTFDLLWNPAAGFRNSKTAVVLESPFRNILTLLFRDGTVSNRYRAIVKGPCIINLKDFPMDTQTCALRFESFTYSTADLRMQWNNESVVIPDSLRLMADFYVSGVNTSVTELRHPAGTWDEAVMEFVIRRRYGWYIINVYVPTYFTVFISWVSFYLGSRAIPARTMIGVSALLAMIFQFAGVMRNLPKVSYVKAIDVWMITGMTFVFSSLLELAVIALYIFKEDGSERKAEEYRFFPPQNGLAVGGFRRHTKVDDNLNFTKDILEPRNVVTSTQVDKFSAVLFPALFGLFNLFYWVYYLS